MIITSAGAIDSQKSLHLQKKSKKVKEETSCKGQNGCSKDRCSEELCHEKRDSGLEDAPSQICENNLKQAQHFPNIQGYLKQRLHEERWRLLTFTRYPSTVPCSSILLARQGFIYRGTGDSVDHIMMCVFCSSLIRISDKKSVDIEEMHRAVNPKCPVVQGFEYGNKPMKEYGEGKFDEISGQLQHLSKLKSSSTAQSYGPEIKSLIAPVPRAATSSSPSQNVTSENAQQLSCNSRQLFVSNETLEPTERQNSFSQLVTNHALSLSFPWQDRSDNQVRPDSDVVSDINENLIQSPTQQNVTSLESNSETSQVSFNTSSSTASSANGRGNSPVGHCPSGGSTFAQTQSQNSNSGSLERTQDHTNISSSSSPSQNDPLSSDQSALPDSSPDQNVRDEDRLSSSNSYDKLGIIISRPKRPEYALEINRHESFQGWPEGHHILAEDLARAGYFYTGYGDCARCFHCGGGLRNWELGDNIWVEHARWFPKCPFMRQSMGQAFINVVQRLSRDQEMISFDDVMREMESMGLEKSLPKGIEDNMLEIRRDPAVRIIVNDGFSEEETVKAAQKVKESDQSLGADLIYEELFKQDVKRQSGVAKCIGDSPSVSQRSDKKRDQETIEAIKDNISGMRQLSLCKICMDKEVSVVFLPCSHYVSCNDCSFALRSCPFCREDIKGVVRAFLN